MTEATSSAKLAPLFTWRSAVSDSDLPPTIRHCLLALSLYMNERGGSAFPGAARLSHDTGYHKSTVKSALRVAYKSGWLKVVQMGGTQKEGRRLASEYVAATPYGFVAQPFDPHRGQRTPGGPDDDDWGSWPSVPGPQDAPISSLNSPENSQRRSGKCGVWVEVEDAKAPTVAACPLNVGHDGPHLSALPKPELKRVDLS